MEAVERELGEELEQRRDGGAVEHNRVRPGRELERRPARATLDRGVHDGVGVDSPLAREVAEANPL